MSEWLIHIIFSFLSTIGFGIVTNIPRRAFIASGFTGVCGWLSHGFKNHGCLHQLRHVLSRMSE